MVGRSGRDGEADAQRLHDAQQRVERRIAVVAERPVERFAADASLPRERRHAPRAGNSAQRAKQIFGGAVLELGIEIGGNIGRGLANSLEWLIRW
jgi:hypothetical protein